MSHRAVNWALEQRHLKPGPWIVLLQLGDRHNKDTKQVNPEQATLAADCNMSRATVNRHLDDLEALGLLRRIPRQHPVTRKRLSTFYILGLDFAAPPVVENAMSQVETRKEKAENGAADPGHVSDCDTETVSQKSQKPCLKNSENRVSNCDTNPVREPGREPCAAAAAHTFDFDEFLGRFLRAYPRPGSGLATAEALRQAIDDGASPDHILAAAKAYAIEQKGNRPQYIALSENWVRQKRWEKVEQPARVDADAIAQQRAKAIREKQAWVARHLSPSAARDLVERKLVTVEECRASGVDL